MDVPPETTMRLEERREVIARNWYEAIAGFFREACRTVLAEQETIRAALVTEIEESGRALLRAQEELEQRVEALAARWHQAV